MNRIYVSAVASVLLGACVTLEARGERCDESEGCEDGLVCYRSYCVVDEREPAIPQTGAPAPSVPSEPVESLPDELLQDASVDAQEPSTSGPTQGPPAASEDAGEPGPDDGASDAGGSSDSGGPSDEGPNDPGPSDAGPGVQPLDAGKPCTPIKDCGKGKGNDCKPCVPGEV